MGCTDVHPLPSAPASKLYGLLNEKRCDSTRAMLRFDIQLGNLAEDTPRENRDTFSEQQDTDSLLVINCYKSETTLAVSQYCFHGFEAICGHCLAIAQLGE